MVEAITTGMSCLIKRDSLAIATLRSDPAIRRIYEKLQVRMRTEAVAKSLRREG